MNKNYEADEEDIMTSEEILEHEDDYIAGLLSAAEDVSELEQPVDIIRKGKKFFTFRIHPLSENEINDIRKRYTKYAKNKRQGIRVPEELDTAKYRASLIYNSTVDADKRKLWDNPEVKKGLIAQGKVIINALDVIDAVLLPGEKSRLMDIIDDLNGYGDEEVKVDTAKN